MHWSMSKRYDYVKNKKDKKEIKNCAKNSLTKNGLDDDEGNDTENDSDIDEQKQTTFKTDENRNLSNIKISIRDVLKPECKENAGYYKISSSTEEISCLQLNKADNSITIVKKGVAGKSIIAEKFNHKGTQDGGRKEEETVVEEDFFNLTKNEKLETEPPADGDAPNKDLSESALNKSSVQKDKIELPLDVIKPERNQNAGNYKISSRMEEVSCLQLNDADNTITIVKRGVSGKSAIGEKFNHKGTQDGGQKEEETVVEEEFFHLTENEEDETEPSANGDATNKDSSESVLNKLSAQEVQNGHIAYEENLSESVLCKSSDEEEKLVFPPDGNTPNEDLNEENEEAQTEEIEQENSIKSDTDGVDEETLDRILSEYNIVGLDVVSEENIARKQSMGKLLAEQRPVITELNDKNNSAETKKDRNAHGACKCIRFDPQDTNEGSFQLIENETPPRKVICVDNLDEYVARKQSTVKLSAELRPVIIEQYDKNNTKETRKDCNALGACKCIRTDPKDANKGCFQLIGNETPPRKVICVDNLDEYIAGKQSMVKLSAERLQEITEPYDENNSTETRENRDAHDACERLGTDPDNLDAIKEEDEKEEMHEAEAARNKSLQDDEIDNILDAIDDFDKAKEDSVQAAPAKRKSSLKNRIRSLDDDQRHSLSQNVADRDDFNSLLEALEKENEEDTGKVESHKRKSELDNEKSALCDKQKCDQSRNLSDQEVFDSLLKNYEKENEMAEKLSTDLSFIDSQIGLVASEETMESDTAVPSTKRSQKKLDQMLKSGKITPSEIGRCFQRGFREDRMALSGETCFAFDEDEKSKYLEAQESFIYFSEKDTPLEYLLALGFSVDEASNAIKDEDIRNRLNAAITEARVWVNSISTTQGTLLYLLSYKAKPKIMRYFLHLVEAIINRRITNAVKLDGFLKLLEHIEDGEINIITVLGKGRFEDEENENKLVKQQMRQAFRKVYSIAVEEAANENKTLSNRSIRLLSILSAKYRAGLVPHLELIARYIGRELLVTEVQLEAAMIYLSRLNTANVKIEEFERYCAITPSNE